MVITHPTFNAMLMRVENQKEAAVSSRWSKHAIQERRNATSITKRHTGLPSRRGLLTTAVTPCRFHRGSRNWYKESVDHEVHPELPTLHIPKSYNANISIYDVPWDACQYAYRDKKR